LFIQTILNEAKKGDSGTFSAYQELEFYNLDPYITALNNDDEVKRERCHSTKHISSSTNGIVKNPFHFEEQILQTISSQLTELHDNRVGFANVSKNSDRSEVISHVRHGPFLSILESDRSRLEPGQFLNDTLIEF